MSRWKVGDVMTTGVVSVDQDASFRRIVELLEGQEVSGLPVVDGSQRVVGLVSEADLLPKMEYAGVSAGPQLFQSRRYRVARQKAAGDSVCELMSTPAVTVHPWSSLVEAARVMDRAGVKRLPVVDEFERLVGIVTRGDLLKVFLRSDEEIYADIRTEFGQLPGLDPEMVRVAVADGVVTLAGDLPRRSLVTAALRLAERVDGVIDVVSRLTFQHDDVTPVAMSFP